MNLDSKIEISVGCSNFLLEETTRLRRENESLKAQKQIVDNFFNMVNRLEGKTSQGYDEDRLWQAKKEIEDAMRKLEESDSKNHEPACHCQFCELQHAMSATGFRNIDKGEGSRDE